MAITVGNSPPRAIAGLVMHGGFEEPLGKVHGGGRLTCLQPRFACNPWVRLVCLQPWFACNTLACQMLGARLICLQPWFACNPLACLMLGVRLICLQPWVACNPLAPYGNWPMRFSNVSCLSSVLRGGTPISSCTVQCLW